MLLLDSLQIANPQRLEPEIRKYVSMTSHLSSLQFKELMANHSLLVGFLHLQCVRAFYFWFNLLFPRFVLDIHKAEERPEIPKQISRIPLKIPKVTFFFIASLGHVVCLESIGWTINPSGPYFHV